MACRPTVMPPWCSLKANLVRSWTGPVAHLTSYPPSFFRIARVFLQSWWSVSLSCRFYVPVRIISTSKTRTQHVLTAHCTIIQWVQSGMCGSTRDAHAGCLCFLSLSALKCPPESDVFNPNEFLVRLSHADFHLSGAFRLRTAPAPFQSICVPVLKTKLIF